MNAAKVIEAVKSRLLALYGKHKDFAHGFACGVLLLLVVWSAA